MRLNFFNVFLIAALSVPHFPADSAAEEERQIEVQRVNFNRNATLSGDTRRWYEATVELNVRGSADRDVVNPRYVDNIEVTLNLSFEVSRGDVETTRFFRSSVELPTLERGRYPVHFFLPPEVISRDRISGDPQAYLVKLSADGVEQEFSSSAVSRLLERESVRANFESRIESDAGGNDGILLPLHLTPFVNERQYLREMPSVRRAGER